LPIENIEYITRTKLPETSYTDTGWISEDSKLDSIASRAPTHEPYAKHNKAVQTMKKVSYAPKPAPAAPSPAVSNKLSTMSKITTPVDIKDLAKQDRSTASIGAMSSEEVGSVMAQKAKAAAAAAGKSVTEMSSSINLPSSGMPGGIGKFNITPDALEKSGYLKSGTVDRFLKDNPGQIQDVLNSPSVWTGKEGISAAESMLGNEKVQTALQSSIMENSYADLKKSGLITGSESSNVIASMTSVANDFGVGGVKDWIGGTSSADMNVSMDSVARGAQYASDFASKKLPELTGNLPSNLNIDSLQSAIGNVDASSLINNLSSNSALNELAQSVGGIDSIAGSASAALDLVSGALASTSLGSLFGGGAAPKTSVPAAVTQVVDRSSIDSAMTSLVGNAKVSLPNYTGVVDAAAFELPSLSGLVGNAQNASTGDTVEICQCSDPTLIAPSKAECEAAGGTWECKTVNNSNTPPLTSV